MKILMINKFLFPNGGSETYIFKLGDYLKQIGHEVQYFGMEHSDRCVSNCANAYTSNMDFHSHSKIAQITYSLKTIYSKESRVQIRKVLEKFKPDVCHLNNFNYQLTPSIILEIVKWRNETGHQCKIVYTAHDYQLICPNHMLNNPNTHQNCEKCVGNHFFSCIKGRCIHGSILKSMIGTLEAVYWNRRGTYKFIDRIICCSDFIKSKLDTNPIFQGKTTVLRNFSEGVERKSVKKNKYVLYFGRFSWEKGVRTLIEAAKRLPEIEFIFAGTGEYSVLMQGIPNIKNVGYQSGEDLNILIREAKFSVCPSEWYENCPFSIMESQERGTVVIGANIGGIPELILDNINGLLFESGNVNSLVNAITKLWEDNILLEEYEKQCALSKKIQVDEYAKQYLKICEVDRF